jgi:hypothetical protein
MSSHQILKMFPVYVVAVTLAPKALWDVKAEPCEIFTDGGFEFWATATVVVVFHPQNDVCAKIGGNALDVH